MSDTVKILVKEVKMSTESKGMKLVTAVVGTETKVYKFSELKQDGTPRKGYTDIKEGEFTCYINGEYIASAYPVQTQGFKGGGFQKQPYKQDPQTQREIIRQNCVGNAVVMCGQIKYPEGTTLTDRCNAALAIAKNFENWVREGHKDEPTNTK